MDLSSCGQFEKRRLSAPALRAPLDDAASLEEGVILVLQGNRDEMATRDHWVWMASLDFQAPREKKVHQETLAPGEPKDKMELLGLLDPLGPLGPLEFEVLLETLGKMAQGEHKAQRVPKENLDKMARWAQRDLPELRVSLEFLVRRVMMGYQASQGSQDPLDPRASQAARGLKERTVWTVPQDQRGNPAHVAPMEHRD